MQFGPVSAHAKELRNSTVTCAMLYNRMRVENGVKHIKLTANGYPFPDDESLFSVFIAPLRDNDMVVIRGETL